MKKLTLLLSTVLLSTPALAALSPTAEGFARNAAISSEFELQSSKLALQKSQSDKVKEFAQQMIDDHTKAAADLKEALEEADANAELATPKELDPKHQALLDNLSNASGAAFDQQFIAAQKQAHDQAVNLFRQYSENGDNEELQDFAENTLATLEEHQEHAQELSQSVE